MANDWLRNVAVAIHRMLTAHNPVVVPELKHAVHGTDTTEHATSSPPTAGKCVDEPTVWY
jgi:hypothetical protein